MSLVDYFPIDLAALIEKATLTTLKVVSFFTDIAIIDSESKLHWRREVISGVMNVWIDNIYYDGSFSSFIVIQSIAGTIIPVTPMPDLNLSDNVLDIINDGFDVFSITRNGDVVRCSASQAARTSSLANTVTSLLANDVGKVGQLDVKDELRSRGSSRPSVAVCISYGEDSFVMIDVEGSCYTLDVDQKKKITFDALKAIPNYSRLFLILTLGYLHIGEERQIKLPARAKDIAVVEKIDSSQQQSVAVEIIILTESGHLLALKKNKLEQIPRIKNIVAISSNGNILLNSKGQVLILIGTLKWVFASQISYTSLLPNAVTYISH